MTRYSDLGPDASAGPPGDAVDRAVDQAVATSVESFGEQPSTPAMPHVRGGAQVAVLMIASPGSSASSTRCNRGVMPSAAR